jgi:hypothetical protein
MGQVWLDLQTEFGILYILCNKPEPIYGSYSVLSYQIMCEFEPIFSVGLWMFQEQFWSSFQFFSHQSLRFKTILWFNTTIGKFTQIQQLSRCHGIQNKDPIHNPTYIQSVWLDLRPEFGILYISCNKPDPIYGSYSVLSDQTVCEFESIFSVGLWMFQEQVRPSFQFFPHQSLRIKTILWFNIIIGKFTQIQQFPRCHGIQKEDPIHDPTYNKSVITSYLSYPNKESRPYHMKTPNFV